MSDDTLTRPAEPPGQPATDHPAAAAPGRPVVIATLLRQRGRTGVETHVRTTQGYLRSVARPETVLTPFAARSPALYPVFAMRHGLDLVNPAWGVWWYRAGHVTFLRQALRAHLAAAPHAVVYAQCPSSAAAALRERTSQPVVLVAHFNVSEGDEFAQSGLIRRGGRLHRSIRDFEALVLPRLDGIVYVSDHTRGVVEERIPAMTKVPSRTIHNSVPIIDRTPAPPIGDLVTVGALERRKNHGYLLEILAAARSRGHRYSLSVVGDGPERPRLEQLARQLGVADQVRFYGYSTDPRELMARHKYYCHTATVESFGLVVIEAMAEGLPVLAGRVGGVVEIVRDGVDGAFWPLEDAAAAATILVEAMSDPTASAARASAAAARARAAFSTRTQGAALLEFLDAATVRSPSAPRKSRRIAACR